MSKADLEDLIKHDPNVQAIVLLEGDRYIIRIPIGDILGHPTLQAIRGKQPDIAILTTSMASTGNTSVYTPCLFAERDGGSILYYVADGHQRVQAAKDNGSVYLVCQVITRWETAEQAFNECVNLQAARFEMTDQDLFSILRSNVLTVAAIAKQTGRKETTLQKMKNVSSHKLLTDMIDAGVMTTNIASNIIVKCNNNAQKVDAFLNTLQDTFAAKKAEADHWKNKLGPNPKGKEKDRTDVRTYFKDVDWKKWEAAVDKDGKINVVDGRAVLDFSEFNTDGPEHSLVVGDTADSWEKEIPIVMTTTIHEQIPLNQLEEFLHALPLIKKNMEIIIARRKKAQAAVALPLVSGNTVIDVPPPPAPVTQVPKMKIIKAAE